MCEMTDVLELPERWECVTCGYEWEKDLPLKGSSQVLKGGTKSKPIRLVDGDHEISCKIEGVAIGLKACFVRKA